MNCLLIDDQPDSLELLTLLIGKYYPGLHILGQYLDIRQGLEAIQEKRPDLVFLEAGMYAANSFEWPDWDLQIIFTASDMEQAIRAINYKGVGLLLKPIDRNDLMGAVQKALGKSNPLLPARERISLPTSSGIYFLQVADIEYCHADGNYTKVYVAGKPEGMLFARPLREVEEMLRSGAFYRTHHSYLVNLKKVEQYIRGEGGQLRMPGGGLVPVARPKKQEVLERLSQI